VASTIRAASLLAAGQAVGVVTVKVAALTDGVVKAMFVTKIKSVLAVVLVVGLALGGIGVGVGLPTNTAAVAQQPDGKKFVPGGKDKPKPDETTADLLRRIPDNALVAEVLRRAVLADDKEKQEDGKKRLPGEIKRELNRGVVLRVKLVELDPKALLMTADVEPTKDVINPKKPARLTNMPLAVSAIVTATGKELKLTDLKPGDILRLQLESWKTDGEAMAVTYIRVEDGTDKKPNEKEDKKPEDKEKRESQKEVDDLLAVLTSGSWAKQLGNPKMPERCVYTFAKDGTYKSALITDHTPPTTAGRWNLSTGKSGEVHLQLKVDKADEAKYAWLGEDSVIRYDRKRDVVVISGPGYAGEQMLMREKAK
jgi:hypothetical protein